MFFEIMGVFIMKFLSRRLAWKLILPTPIALLILVISAGLLIPRIIASNATDAAALSATETVNQFKTIRGYYTKNVIVKAKKSGALKPSINHAADPNAIPLPATFIHDLSRLLRERDTTINLYSAYPFPNRTDRRLDDFQQQAWEYLNSNPDTTFVRRETVDGKETVRVAIADRMQLQGCVDCHNSHPDTPKADWRLGDVRGILEVSTAIDGQLAAGQELTNVIMIAILFAGIVLVAVSSAATRLVTQPLSRMASYVQDVKAGVSSLHLPAADRADEIGGLARALVEIQETGAVAARAQSALDNASANFMIADADFNIVYVNQSAQELFEAREAEMRQDLPNLDARNLIGANIDMFHENPAHQRGILDGLRQPHESRLTIGGVVFDLIVTPAFNDKGERIATSVQWTDITEKLATEEEMARAKATIDGTSTNFMIADADYNIVYINKALVELFRGREGEIRQELPAFDLNNLVGTDIDVFHKNPSHQRNLLDGLTAPHYGRITVADLTFDLTVTPVFGPGGERVGTSVEWSDVTAQLAVEHEIAELVQAAGAGDFSTRLEEAGKQGFMLELAKGMNELVGTVDRGLNETVSVMSAMAQGDLTRRIEGDYRGTFLKLKDDSNQMAEKIGGIAKRIVGATGTVSDATSEIASGAGDLSSRTEQQASSLEETAASMEELSATVRQNADNAQQANQLAVAARDAASNGGEVVASAVDAMSKIESSSKQITEIMGMIDEIAFQTNLLALNAAVEAARAGEAGKGFAVVATEVRALAQRSGKASKEIKELIGNSDSQVRDGVGLVQKAGTSLEEIVTSVKKVADIISDIAAASKEQASGIDEVGTAVSNMDEMTQQNAALVEETTAALHSMTGQIDDLKTLVRFFKTGKEEDELDLDAASAPTLPTPDGNPVHQQQKTLETKVAAVGGSAAPAATVIEPADGDWQEY